MPSPLGAAAALLALLASQSPSHFAHASSSSPSPADISPMIAGFSEFVSGEGFLAVPVGTVQRPPREAKSKGKRAGQAFESQLENKDFFYATDVNIGSPPQRVTVLVDTGSSELWVNPDCRTALTTAQSQQCVGFGRYDPGQSQTPPDGPFGKEVINYGDPSDQTTQTSVSIRYYRDTITLGKASIANQTFGVVSASQGQSQGILGLAPALKGGVNSDKPYSLVLNTMAAQGVIASRVFSLDLRHSAADQGAVIYGGVDRSKFVGRLERRPVVRGVQGEYRLAVELNTVGVTLSSKPRSFDVDGEDANVMLDSGTTVSRMHSNVALPILEALDARDDGEGYYKVPCSMARTRGSVDFGFGGKTIRVPLSEFILDLTGSSSVCYVGLVLTTDQQILGDSVLRAGYFVFDWDNEAVHVAQAANCGKADIVAVGSGPDAVPRVTGNCREDDARPTGTDEPTRTRHSNYPTEAYTTVYTVTSCPTIDPSCKTGAVVTQTIKPGPSGIGSGGGDDNAGTRAGAARWLPVVMAALSLTMVYGGGVW
ncbi:eukaryotic aspartyl protease [Hirsutella rhossiliensis]|uniref:Eukaryotic aspartyl protease domain-containing protein n=1 Tax=Hirsutella rhossiliensis TaxID=111463 RepID=A0A9P8SII5_9HYPO|nr:eukaryotic aspartyl protease domain-containing protein [Hirsutella rhossiliensis]KAH0964248.1 eukaryotic aspartyl protease domain-containing protein [Hirsutella rhossiliensis]